MRILGLASRVETGGDGVTLSIYKKGAASAPLYTHTFASDEEGEQQIMVGDPGASDTYVNVEAGDVIFFVVKAGETVNVEMEIDENMLKFWDENMEFTAENGEFEVFLGTDSDTENKAKFILA